MITIREDYLLSAIDISVFVCYFIIVLAIGVYFYRKNKNEQEYFLGDGTIGYWHIGLSVVATDVGGGFSIGLGGLGFTMGIAGSWMLFTGLLGAWIAAVLLIPKVKPVASEFNFSTFPQLFKHFFSPAAAFIAAIISFVGYVGFSSSQIMAGAKLASATFPQIEWDTAVIIMGIIAVAYTALGGMKAVIYTDTVQWIILMFGLIVLGIPFAWYAVGGWQKIQQTVAPEMFDLFNIHWYQLVNWMITIIPIWFVGMTLYQRIYASKDIKHAKKAWLVAGLFEYPVMAFMGVLLGILARVAYQQGMFEMAGKIDPEMGLPLLLKNVLPVGIIGLLLSAYFSAIMSTADSCVMAASGNLVTDILPAFSKRIKNNPLKAAIYATALVGMLSVGIALYANNVLQLMLMSYAFMVSGLFVPTLAIIYAKSHDARAAIAAMISGGSTTVLLQFSELDLPLNLDANFFGLSVSAVAYLIIHFINKNKNYGNKSGEIKIVAD